MVHPCALLNIKLLIIVQITQLDGERGAIIAFPGETFGLNDTEVEKTIERNYACSLRHDLADLQNSVNWTNLFVRQCCNFSVFATLLSSTAITKCSMVMLYFYACLHHRLVRYVSIPDNLRHISFFPLITNVL
jgi:hypothetical protein